MIPTSQILKRIAKNSSEHSTGIYTRLYRYLLRQDIYLNAYQNLYSNKGAGTKGINSDTADGFSIDYVQDLIGKLKNQTYQPKPVKRIFMSPRVMEKEDRWDFPLLQINSFKMQYDKFCRQSTSRFSATFPTVSDPKEAVTAHYSK